MSNIDQHVRLVIERLTHADPKYAHLRDLTLMLVGRAGVGKSSTVNSLLGIPAAQVDRWKSVTDSVTRYTLEIRGINCTVIDTPGLCDDLASTGNDTRYLEEMRRTAELAHCVLFVSRLGDTRLALEEKNAIDMLTKSFGKELWSHAVVVFTFANELTSANDYNEAVTIRSGLFQAEISRRTGNTEAVPCIAIDNNSKVTPDGVSWRDTFYNSVLQRITAAGFAQFVLATISSRPSSDQRPSDDKIQPSFTPSVIADRVFEPTESEIAKRADIAKARITASPHLIAVFMEFGKILGGFVDEKRGEAMGALGGIILWIAGRAIGRR